MPKFPKPTPPRRTETGSARAGAARAGDGEGRRALRTRGRWVLVLPRLLVVLLLRRDQGHLPRVSEAVRAVHLPPLQRPVLLTLVLQGLQQVGYGNVARVSTVFPNDILAPPGADTTCQEPRRRDNLQQVAGELLPPRVIVFNALNPSCVRMLWTSLSRCNLRMNQRKRC